MKKLNKLLIVGIICIICFILDNSLMPFFAIKTIYPSLLFTFVVCYSISSGSWEGLWLGIFSGFLQDIYFINGFWTNTFVNMIICFVAGFVGANIFRQKRFIPVIACLLLSILKGVLLFVILWLSGMTINISDVFFTSVYNMIVCIFMYIPVYRFCKIDSMKSEWKF
ncbi:rod shape-determining protein MreD [Clostridium tyrobutyricum]|uniref:Rod shape-determining protein MreD n=1 Tax=Clostridium tyrobutyricum DIVETGP TaxID=1408889 RepID=W6N8C5_CLOTY|nr:rod shape-determining protein MreD [Clostridium tyrobutyricum]AND85708.1 hypothetical protein CTK_C24620 [Clostridium tyrobutyricum]ANP70227.1 rod shape-determining protein MreD [Clostridium tyrobutyricum]MBV4434655.1 rod shape-determining protein MreD [Clostridium tyrobutyricum]QNB65412.1 rod shape-determining protein MreD [Clostridium tyrobutyricum]CDL92816.1 Rod shape-determining protein MreD [Clostridium tyrobutyricum DIVETGP]